MRPAKYLHHVSYEYATDYSTGSGLCEIYRDEPLTEGDRETVQQAIAAHNGFPAVVVIDWTLSDTR